MPPRSLPFPLAIALLGAMSARGQTPILRATPPAQAGAPVQFAFQGPAGVVWAMVFYRVAGEEQFRNLPLKPGTGGLGADLPPGELGGTNLQFYLAYKGPQGIRYLPEDAPSSMETLALPASATGPEKGSRFQQKVPFHVEASLEQVVYRSHKVDQEKTFFSNGQVALGYEAEAGEHHLSVNTRIAYQDQPLPGRSRWSVSQLRGLYTFREHRAQVGDMAIQESEFTVGGAGRRGLDYLYDDRTIYAHLFAVNTQQLGGFQGVAWPVKGTELFGGALGYAWQEGRVKSKLVFLTGRDDPSQGVNIGAAPFITRREGSTAGVTVEAALLDYRLNLNGEYARTNYDRDLDDALSKVQDQAWRIGGAWNDRGYSAWASYRQIGRDFGSLGYPVMEADRRGANGGFSLTLSPAWSFNANATSERNNPSADPLETRARNDMQSLDARWMPVTGLTFKAGLSRAEQEAATPQGAQVPFANSKRSGIFGGLDWALGPQGALALSVQLDKLEGTGTSTTVGRSTTVILGGAFQVPDRLRLAPTLSYSKSTDEVSGQDSKVASGFLNADITLLPRRLNLALNGGYNRLEAPGIPVTTSTSGDASLQFQLTPYLERQLHRGQAMLALRYRYTRVQTLPEPDQRASLALHFSF